MRKTTVITVTGLLLAIIGALLAWQGWQARGALPAAPTAATLKLHEATLFNDSAALPAFRLMSAQGELGNAALSGHWTLMFFGYTWCPDICPTTLAVLQAMTQEIAARRLPAPQVWMVSVDPARDTPARLAEYVKFFNPAFVGATASDAELSPLTKNLGVFFQRHEKDGARYSVDHSAAVYLIDPQGRLKAAYALPQNAARMADDYAALVQ